MSMATKPGVYQLTNLNAAQPQQIPQIPKDDGELTIDPEEIKETFTTFYSNLCFRDDK